MRKTLGLAGRFALLVCISLFREVGGACVVGAQSVDTAGGTLGLIILIEPKERKGALRVKQGKRVKPINAVEGMLVRRGYILNLGTNARATVICGDGKKRELAPGPQGCPCTKPCTPEVCGIHYDGSTIGATRGPDTEKGAFPVVISPRKTMLRDLRPTIRWAPFAGAKQSTVYKVTLFGDGMRVIWTKEVASETSVRYPDSEAPLTSGRTYKVVVTSDGLSSEKDSSPGLGFTTLTAEQARAVADDENERRRLKLPETQTRFLVSNLLAARELYSEAIEQLEILRTTMKQPAVAMKLGDLYSAIGLSREAEKYYLEALSLTPENDFEERALTQRNLGRVYENVGSFAQAIARVREARKAYQRLRNRAMVSTLLKDERRLKKSRGRR